MLAILPILVLTLIIRLLYEIFRRDLSDTSWRLAILGGATLWGTCIVLITEGLSLFHTLTRNSVAVSWAAACFVLGYMLFRQLRKNRGTECPSHIEERSLFNPESCRSGSCDNFSFIERFSLIGLSLIATLTLVIVLVAAPNNWDSLTYHLPRVMHWIQNQSMAFFVTPDARQICFPPLSEYHILQYQILRGSDRLAALPQWLAFVGSIIAASLLARQLGVARRYQILAAVIAGTLPMGILQATSTQNDLTVAFWLTTACAFGLATVDKPKLYLGALFGMAAGLSLLTKTTSYLFSAPIILLFTLALLYRHRITGLKIVFAAGILALALNLPHYIRNAELCGNPLGDGPHLGIKMQNQTYVPKTLLSNLARNAGLQLITPSTRINEFIELGIRFGHKVIRADINDPATTFCGNHYETKWLSTFEDDAANPLHFILIIALLPFGWLLIPPGPCRSMFLAGVIGLTGGAILFCWLLMWQPFHSRQHVTLFLLASPLIAAAISQLRYARQWSTGLTVILLLTSFPYVFGNEMRPLLFPMTPKRFGATNIFSMPREQQYLTGRPLPETWRAAARYIADRKYQSIGLKVQWIACEYPIWLIFKESEQPPHLQHVGVTNMPFTRAMKTAAMGFTPDAILRFSDLGVIRLQPAPDEMICNGQNYSRTWSAHDPDQPDIGAEIYTPDRLK